MKYQKVAQRFSEILGRCDMTARELAEKSNVSEASISQYVNGNHKPSNVSSTKMARVLNVNPLWLMGYEVSRDQTSDVVTEDESGKENHQVADALRYSELMLRSGFILKLVDDFNDVYTLSPVGTSLSGLAVNLDINGVQEFNRIIETNVSRIAKQFLLDLMQKVLESEGKTNA